ncbi:hypothetical protein GOB57_08140 [Sinorhizobium meliloti]|nr:hypothetical protein [Sinorhizobium meliloti]
MNRTPASNVIDVLKNIVLACEANGLRDLPFVRDGRRVVDAHPSAPAAELVKELRQAAELENEDHVQQDHYHGELLTKAADTLEALGAPATAVGWETEAEWEMEQQMFHACGRSDVPKDVQKLIGQVWKQYCLAAAPKELEPEAQVSALTHERVDDGQRAAAEAREHKAVAIAKMLFERTDFNLRINDLWSDAAKEMAAYILSRCNREACGDVSQQAASGGCLHFSGIGCACFCP